MNKIPCRIDDGPQYDDDWVDDIRDMEPLDFLELAIEQLPQHEILDWYVDAVIDELHANDRGAFKELLEAMLDLPPTRRTTLRRVFEQFSGELLHKAFENAAKKMMENEDVAGRVFYRE